MWTKADVVILKEHYPNSTKAELEALIPNHSWSSIRWKANSLNLFLRRTTVRRKRSGAYVTCEVCGTEFYVPLARVRGRQAVVRYCSMACRNIAFKGKGNPFYGRRHSDDYLRKQAERFKGKPQKGRPPKRFRIVNGEHTEFSIDFSTKSSIKNKIRGCEVCGYKDEPRILVLHHRDGNHKHNSPDNLIILCHNCHALAHLKLLDERGFDAMPLSPHIGFRRKEK